MTSLDVGILISLYLLPSFIALLRHHHNVSGIVIVNVLTGWTGVGWIAALVMACLPGPPAAAQGQVLIPTAHGLYDANTGERILEPSAPRFDSQTGERLAP